MWFLISNFVDDVKSHCQKVGYNLNSVIFLRLYYLDMSICMCGNVHVHVQVADA